MRTKIIKIKPLLGIVLIGFISLYWTTLKVNPLGEIEQREPVFIGDTITFKIINYAGPDPIEVAWDFGDGNGLTPYYKDSIIKYAYKEPGIYEVFARFKDQLIPATHTQTITYPLQDPLPDNSSNIRLDNEGKYIWAVNPDNNSITKIDVAKLTVTGEYKVGRHPRNLSFDKKGNIWVTNQDDYSIWILNPKGGIEEKISLPYASRPFGICMDPMREKAYVSLQATGKLVKINVSKIEVEETIDVGPMPRGLAVSSDGKEIYVTRFISPVNRGEVVKVKAVPFQKEKTIEIAYDPAEDTGDNGRGVPNFLSGITISPDGKTAWIPSKKDNVSRGMWRDGQLLNSENTVRTISSQINLATGKENLSGRIDYTDHDMAYAIAFSPFGNLAFLVFQGNNEIEIVNIYTRARLGSIDSTGLAPQGLAFNRDGSRLFVNNFMSRSVVVYDTHNLIRSYSIEAPKLKTIQKVKNELLEPEVLLGKQIFYNTADKRMTKDGYISCASCHIEGMSDERVWDFTERGEGLRNTHFLLGKGGAGMGPVHWTSNFDEIQDFENDIRSGFDGSGFMSDEEFNKGTRKDPLGDSKAGISKELDALAAYVTSLDKVNPSPYRNQDGTLPTEAEAGKKVYIKLGCQACHSGKTFTDRTDFKFYLHDVGTLSDSSGTRRNEPLVGFGTPTLKGVWESAPYLHNGSAKDLYEVFTKRNKEDKHGVTSNLDQTELNNLVAYLKTIDESSEIIGIEEINSTVPVFEVFPTISNNGYFQYRISNLKGKKAQLVLTDLKGQVLRNQKMEKASGNIIEGHLDQLKAGVYLFALKTEGHYLTRKIVVQK